MSDSDILRLVFAGHVDHGKSTLIGRLLFETDSLSDEKKDELLRLGRVSGRDIEYAYVTDQFEEERRDEMTLDTAQAFLRADGRDYVVIDAPGHRELLKNAITGACQADAAILIVDASEGVCEQTRRHAYLLTMIGITDLIVAVNKMDRVGYKEERYREIVGEIAPFLETIGLSARHCIPASAMKGDNVAERLANMPWYGGPTVTEALRRFQPRNRTGCTGLRLPIQDAYHDWPEPIYVGRIESGSLTKGQELLFLPSGRRGRVRAIKEFLSEKAFACKGECVGFTLDSAAEVCRGEVACSPEATPSTVRKIRANVFWLARDPCRLGEKLSVRIATQNAECSVSRISRRMDSSSLAVIEEEAGDLAEAEAARITLETDRPVVVEDHRLVPALGRLVLDRGSRIVAAGTVRESRVGCTAPQALHEADRH